MTTRFALIATAALLAAGCASGPGELASQTTSNDAAPNSASVVLAAYQTAADPTKAALPLDEDESAIESEQLIRPEPLAEGGGLTKDALEQMALFNNPAIGQATARVRALRGKWVQAGLPPNPSVGYSGSEIGGDGTAGQQGGYLGQTFIMAGKLERDQAVVAAEITRAEQELAAIQRRVLTDVRNAYYQALVAQRRVELAEQMLQVMTEAVEASQALLRAKEIPLAGLLQTEVQQENAQVFLQTASNAQDQAWRSLSAVVGGPDLPAQTLEGDVTQLPAELDWHSELARLQAESPEVAAAMAEVARARRALNRACVEAVPDISTQLSVQYDDSSDDTIAGVQVGMPIPLWNKNQGGIQQAQAEITQAQRNMERVERGLSRRLADTFRRYADAHTTAANYAADILPRSQRTLDLVRQGYQQGEVGYLDLLTAQQTYSQTNLAYLDALGELWQSYLLIEGLQLDDSLATPQP